MRSTKINPQVRSRIEKERVKQLEKLVVASVEGEEEKIEGAGGEELKDDIMMKLNEKKKQQEKKEYKEQDNERVKEDARK